MLLTFQLAEARGVLEGKKPTFDQAKAEVFKTLREKGWTIVSGLKVPHATSSDGRFRLWFKAQSVYMNFSDNPKSLSKDMGTAHSMHLDIREVDGPGFLRHVEQWEKILMDPKFQ